MLRVDVRAVLFLVCGAPGWAVGARAQAGAGAPVTISLTEAIYRAERNEPVFAAAAGAARSAAIDRYLAKAALLPTVTYRNQLLYTQPNGQTNQGGQIGFQSSPVFIANNAVHEYESQASIDETIGLRQVENAKVATANAARAAAELEVTRRGLVATVVTLYFEVSAAKQRLALMRQALQEAQTFTRTTGEREAAREVAHADVVKAELQEQQRQRDVSDAELAEERARLELAVLLFADPRTPYGTEKSALPALPTRAEVDAQASTNNPEIRSALADVQASHAEVAAAKAAYLPELAMNFSYGIDAPQFAHRGPEDVRNLGYSIMGTLDIPVWDWFATHQRVKQSEIRRDVAKIALTAAQRRLIASLDEAYAEATAAHAQLASLDASVKTAAESLRLTKLRYAAGEATALEVVDAQGAYLAAGLAQAGGVMRYRSALASLQILTGSL